AFLLLVMLVVILQYIFSLAHVQMHFITFHNNVSKKQLCEALMTKCPKPVVFSTQGLYAPHCKLHALLCVMKPA
ncbi:MAG: hypothetical protein AAGF56_12715, partial [Pseudomonadota bacterium]